MHVQTYVCTYMHTSVIHTYKHTCTHVYIHACTYLHMYIYTHIKHTYTRTDIHIHTYTPLKRSAVAGDDVSAICGQINNEYRSNMIFNIQPKIMTPVVKYARWAMIPDHNLANLCTYSTRMYKTL